MWDYFFLRTNITTMTAVSTAQMEIQGITQSLLGSLVCGALEGIVSVGSVAGVEGAVGSVTSGSVTGGWRIKRFVNTVANNRNGTFHIISGPVGASKR